MTGYPPINFNPYNMYNYRYYNYNNPAFRGVQNTNLPVSVPQSNVNLQTPPDTVSFRATEHIQTKPKKEGLSTGAKWGIGLGLTALTGVGIYLLSRGRANNLSKLFDEKMVLSNLPENLTYKEAKTVDEGIRYAKEVLKIPTVDDKFSLEAINYVNKGLVDVSNANKGKLLMPKSLSYVKMGDNVRASMNHEIQTANFANLSINSQYFDGVFLKTKIQEKLKLGDSSIFKLDKTGNIIGNPKLKIDSEFTELIKKYLSNEPMSINEMRSLYWSLNETQSKILTKGLKNDILLQVKPPETTIYHEMGHLQDYYINLKKLMMEDNTLSKVKKALTTDENIASDTVNNRFLKKGDLKKGDLLRYKDNPQLLKEDFPLLHEHLYNKSIQDIAGQVSWYSQQGVGEFVAEVYSGLISGQKFSDDVMALYKKYGGPVLT